MKYDVTTSHMFTQHWIIDAKDKDLSLIHISEPTRPY